MLTVKTLRPVLFHLYGPTICSSRLVRLICYTSGDLHSQRAGGFRRIARSTGLRAAVYTKVNHKQSFGFQLQQITLYKGFAFGSRDLAKTLTWHPLELSGVMTLDSYLLRRLRFLKQISPSLGSSRTYD